MAIATITPLNQTQTSLLTQALDGSTGVLAQALNSAIQAGMQQANIQLQQENQLITEQQRNIANERAERRAAESRAFRLMEFGRSLGQDRRAESAENRAETQFGFQQDDRALAAELGVTGPEVARANLDIAEGNQEIRRDEAAARTAERAENRDIRREESEIRRERLDVERERAAAARQNRARGEGSLSQRDSYFEALQATSNLGEAEAATVRNSLIQGIRMDPALSATERDELLKTVAPQGRAERPPFTEAQRNTMLQRISSIDVELANTQSSDPDEEQYMPEERRRVLERERNRLMQQAQDNSLVIDGPGTTGDVVDSFFDP